ncbi:hypothetical protein GCM10017600_16100 [Streptosporangium carneum]|uniref:Uncharacterized protein n=1 Tax=Streptosporangium carneum TaxID=47481 RepID=A0A9W6HXH5_9ACTN|nr:hypothetical protein GCM10017600_16100 [Streptosporangium carneum]
MRRLTPRERLVSGVPDGRRGLLLHRRNQWKPGKGDEEELSGLAATDGAGDAREIDVASPRESLSLRHVDKSNRSVTDGREVIHDILVGIFGNPSRRHFAPTA